MLAKATIGVVLAGGKSSRMGQDKSRLTWQGKTLLENARQQLKHLKLAQIEVVGGDSGIPDQVEHQGPARAILQFMRQLPLQHNTLVVVVPVDTPKLTSEMLQVLLDKAQEQNGAVCFEQAYLPAILPAGPDWVSIYNKVHNDPCNLSMRRLMKAVNGTQVAPTCEQQSALINVNTPQEWAALYRSS